MTLDEFKKKVDDACDELTADILSIKELTPNDLKEKIAELTEYLARYDELYQKAKLTAGVQSDEVDLVKTLAVKQLSSSGVKATLVKDLVEDVEVEYKDRTTTLNKEKIKRRYYQYAADRYEGMFDRIKTTINSAQSILSYARAELGLNHERQ